MSTKLIHFEQFLMTFNITKQILSIKATDIRVVFGRFDFFLEKCGRATYETLNNNHMTIE